MSLHHIGEVNRAFLYLFNLKFVLIISSNLCTGLYYNAHYSTLYTHVKLTTKISNVAGRIYIHTLRCTYSAIIRTRMGRNFFCATVIQCKNNNIKQRLQ